MVYDADGNRLIRDDGDTVTAYLPQTELTWDRATDTVDGTRYFTHAGQVVAICTGQDVADWTWMAADRNGTTTHSLNAFTAVEQVRRQDPYGNPRGEEPQTWPGQQGFVGGVEDPTGLIQLGARSYDATIGRFVSVDPLLDLTNDQQINGYAYANNNPITFSDPDGLCAPDEFSFCPDYPIENQPVVGNHGSSGSTSDHGQDDGGDDEAPGAPPSPGDEDTSLPCTTQQSCGEYVTKQILGIFKGIGEQFVDMVVGTWDAGKAYYDCLQQYGSKVLCDQAINQAIADDPGGFFSGLWKGTWDPIANDWKNGNYGEAVGRAAFVIAETIFGGKGTTKVLKTLRATPCSFTADTLVLMADGTTKPIAEIEPGDQVLATDPEAGETSPQTVIAVWVHQDTVVDLQVLIPGGPSKAGMSSADGAALAVVSTTADHPFWNHTDRQWQPARDLTLGDQLLAADSSTPPVIGMLSHTQRSTLAYNISVDKIHAYYVQVGTTPVLTHNCPDAPESRGSTGRTTPGGPNERLALDLVRENPQYGNRLPVNMRDPRWPAGEGWVKMEQTVNGVEVHYVYNVRTGVADDFKFKDWSD